MSEASRTAIANQGECQAGSGRTLAQEVFLGILKTADLLEAELAELLKPVDLSPTQYNVLRILRGAGDEGMACGRIADRMLTHDPDMTRLLDRLEKREVIERWRDKADRRVVKTRITGGGQKLLASLDEPILELHRVQLGRIGARELKALAALLARVRERA